MSESERETEHAGLVSGVVSVSRVAVCPDCDGTYRRDSFTTPLFVCGGGGCDPLDMRTAMLEPDESWRMAADGSLVIVGSKVTTLDRSTSDATHSVRDCSAGCDGYRPSGYPCRCSCHRAQS